MLLINPTLSLSTIISNGKLGAGSAALDWATSYNLGRSGWCSKLPIRKTDHTEQYGLQETNSTGYLKSLVSNVCDSDATILFTLTQELTPLGRNAQDASIDKSKPFLHFRPSVDTKWITSFIKQNNVRTLHIVGNREIVESGIYDFVTRSLEQALCIEEVVQLMAA